MGAGTSYSMPWITNSSSVLQGSWRTRALWSGHTGAGPHRVRRRSGLRWREGGGPRAEPFGDEFGDPQGVGDDRQGRVDRGAGDEERGVGDVEVVHLVHPAVQVQLGSRRIGPEADGAGLVGA